MPWTTTDLLADVRRSGMYPSASIAGLADADILAQADKEMHTSLLPLVMGMQEEFYEAYQDVTLVAGQASYKFPARSVGARTFDLAYVLNGVVVNHLTRTTASQLQYVGPVTSAYPQQFMFEGGLITLIPAPSAAVGTLRIRYYVRPSRLVAETSCRTITSILANTPSAGVTRLTFSGGALSGLVDIVNGQTPYDVMASDVSATHNAGSDDISASLLPAQLAVGDYICPSEQSCLVQLPVELQGVLSQRVVARLLKQQGFSSEASMAQDEADRMLEAVRKLLTPRSDGNPKRLLGGALQQMKAGKLWRL